VNVWLNAELPCRCYDRIVDGDRRHEMTSVYVSRFRCSRSGRVPPTTECRTGDGVPDSVPPSRVNPFGRVDVVVKFTVPCPPDCVNVWLNAAPTVPVA
jgi:hypothetical protein